MIHIPSDHFSLPVDTIVKSLPMMSNVMQPEDIDGWLTKLRDNKAVPHLADLPASRPSDFNNNVKLPGIGHPYWKNARDHIFAGSTPPRVPSCFLEPLRHTTAEHCSEFCANFRAGCNQDNANPVYKINWPQSQIKFDRNLGDYLNIKVDPTQPNLYQDGSPLGPGIITYHGTREIALKSILFSGLKSSTRSHKVVGLWLNDCQQSAVSWNCSLLDQSPCLCCVVNANPAFDRQNAEIMQGQESRRISELRKDMLLPSVLVTDIFVAIPHPDRTTWRKTLFQSFCDTYQYLLDLPLQHRLPRDLSNM